MALSTLVDRIEFPRVETPRGSTLFNSCGYDESIRVRSWLGARLKGFGPGLVPLLPQSGCDSIDL